GRAGGRGAHPARRVRGRVVHRARGGDRRARRPGRFGALGDPRDRLRGAQADRGHGAGARPGDPPRVGARRGPGRDGPRARGAQEPGPAARRAGVPQRHPAGDGPLRPRRVPRPAGRPGPGGAGHHPARRAAPGRHPPGPHALGRQPAEGRARALAAAGLHGAAAGRADPRRRRGGAQRDLRPRAPARRGGGGDPAGVQRGARGARARPPGARGPRGPGRAHRTRGRARRGQGARPGDGREQDVSEPTTAPAADEHARVEEAAARAAEPQPSALGRLLEGGAGRNLGLVAVLVLLGIVGVVTADTFLTTANLLTVLTQASIIGVLTVGVTFVIIGGGIDLSVGKVMALASVWATTVATQSYGPAVMVFCAVAVGVGCGLVNGLLIAYGRIVPFIVTLAMLISAQGLAERISGRRSQIVTDPVIAGIANT